MNINFWKNKKVLITGHTGFKGSWLTLWLKKFGCTVSGISLESEGKSLFNQLNLNQKIDFHNILDINNFDNLNFLVHKFNPDIVFHLAAQPLVREGYKNPLKTWQTNLLGSINLLESLKEIKKKCACIIITTDKVYENCEWEFGYRENDKLGGHDPYSASKAALEIAINSWRDSFCGDKIYQNPYLGIATVRAGNVIGGGDWAIDRIIPDTIRALQSNKPVIIRNPKSKRPWQHVLEPLSGYIELAELIMDRNDNDKYCNSFNFGPKIESNKSIEILLEEIFKHWEGKWIIDKENINFYESKILHLQIDKAYNLLGWEPKWSFSKTIDKTISWYKKTYEGIESPLECCMENINDFMSMKKT